MKDPHREQCGDGEAGGDAGLGEEQRQLAHGDQVQHEPEQVEQQRGDEGRLPQQRAGGTRTQPGVL